MTPLLDFINKLRCPIPRHVMTDDLYNALSKVTIKHTYFDFDIVLISQGIE